MEQCRLVSGIHAQINFPLMGIEDGYVKYTDEFVYIYFIACRPRFYNQYWKMEIPSWQNLLCHFYCGNETEKISWQKHGF